MCFDDRGENELMKSAGMPGVGVRGVKVMEVKGMGVTHVA
jgi:hypothetical protein